MSIQKLLTYLSLSLFVACQETESNPPLNTVSLEIESEFEIDLSKDDTHNVIDNEVDSEIYNDSELEEDSELEGDFELEEDSAEHSNCSLVFPEDPLEAAVYSFVAEYALGMPFAVGCYSSIYPQSPFISTVYELEEEWFYIYGSKKEALYHAQDWVDSNFESFDRETIDLIEEFQITIDDNGISGGFGYQ